MSLSAAAKALAATVKAVAGTAITYRRQPYAVALTAVKGRSEFNVETQPGIVEKIETQDWIISTSDLRLNGSLVLPKRGDVVEEVDGGKTYRWEVMAPGGENVYRFSDRSRIQIRVHSSLIKVVG